MSIRGKGEAIGELVRCLDGQILEAPAARVGRDIQEEIRIAVVFVVRCEEGIEDLHLAVCGVRVSRQVIVPEGNGGRVLRGGCLQHRAQHVGLGVLASPVPDLIAPLHTVGKG